MIAVVALAQLAEQTQTRSGPLVPVWGIVLAGLVVLAALFISARPHMRARLAWLLPEIGVIAALGFVHLLFFWQPYRTGAVVPKGGGDLASFTYPMQMFAAGEVQDGRIPFWNPYLFSGAPHLANFQAGALYPPNLLAYLLADPYTYATLELLAIAHFLIASYGAYWLARTLGIGRHGAVLTGAVYAYSGFLVAHLGHYQMLGVATWAPFIFAAVISTVRRQSWTSAGLGALALTCAILAGHQPVLLMTLTVTAALAGFELWRAGGAEGWGLGAAREDSRFISIRRPPPAARRPLPPLAVMALLPLGLSAPALVPSFELMGRTVRAGLDYATASQFSVQPVALIHLVTPTVFGSNPTDYWNVFSNTEMWGYVGVLTLALAAFAVAARSSRTRLFWGLLAIAALLYLVGPFASVHGWFYAFAPGFDRIRGAGRGYMFFDLAVAVLAGYALTDLLRRREDWSVRERAALKWGVVGLGAALAVVVGFVIPLLASNVLALDNPTNRPVIALDNANMLALFLALGLGVAVAIWRGALRGGALAFAVTLVVLLDIFHATAPFNPTTDPILAGFHHEQAVEFLQERAAADAPFRIESITPRWQPDLALLAGLDDIGGLYDPLGLADYADYRARAIADRSSDAYRNLNVRYVISDPEVGSPGADFTEALTTDDGLVIWEINDPRPRAWIDGDDAEFAFEQRSAGQIDISIPAGTSGTLVISQVAYPGWMASVDGERVDIATRDGTLQQIELPAGAREVELTFQPTGWTLWLLIAALSAVLWLVVFVLSLRGDWRHNRRAVSSPVTTAATPLRRRSKR